jgi:hypothetical protein
VDRATYWRLVEQARPADNDPERHHLALFRLLAELPAEEIASFHDTFWDLMWEAYRADLWSVYALICGFCSDDGFTYCRARLVMQGQDVFETVMESPEYVAEITLDDSELEFEEFLGTARAAYDERTGGQDIPYRRRSERQTRLKGRWVRTKGSYRRRWPELWALTGHPPRIDPTWLQWQAGLVPRMAAELERQRRWSDLPVLADALEEAGCAERLILGHCRAGKRHARTCWVVNFLLGRE